MEERITETELIIPALNEIKKSGNNGMLMSELRPILDKIVNPKNEDLDILQDRSDNKASQKIRNLTSHKTLIKDDYAKYNKETQIYTITEKGKKYLKQVK